MPNAKIIDARRYPLIAALVCSSNYLLKAKNLHMVLEEAASYYNSYIKLMNHWDNVLPNKVLRVNNEDVINDLDGQVRRILDYIEVPFEESCISFHETDRSVRTASSEQVRQPINKKGMGRWKPYANTLKPFVDTLDSDLLLPEDIALIKS